MERITYSYHLISTQQTWDISDAVSPSLQRELQTFVFLQEKNEGGELDR